MSEVLCVQHPLILGPCSAGCFLQTTLGHVCALKLLSFLCDQIIKIVSYNEFFFVCVCWRARLLGAKAKLRYIPYCYLFFGSRLRICCAAAAVNAHGWHGWSAPACCCWSLHRTARPARHQQIALLEYFASATASQREMCLPSSLSTPTASSCSSW